jgi:chemotaxis protein histidine kinase CheA
MLIPTGDGRPAAVGSESATDPELAQLFAAGARERLGQAWEALASLGMDRSDRIALAELARALHSLRGMARFVGRCGVSRLARGAEDLLQQARNGALTLGEEELRLLREALDALELATGEDCPTGTQWRRLVDLSEELRSLSPTLRESPDASTEGCSRMEPGE